MTTHCDGERHARASSHTKSYLYTYFYTHQELKHKETHTNIHIYIYNRGWINSLTYITYIQTQINTYPAEPSQKRTRAASRAWRSPMIMWAAAVNKSFVPMTLNAVVSVEPLSERDKQIEE